MRKENKHLQFLQQAIGQEAAELEFQQNNSVCQVRESILMCSGTSPDLRNISKMTIKGPAVVFTSSQHSWMNPLKTVSSCSVSSCLEKETNPYLTTTTFQEVVESDKVTCKRGSMLLCSPLLQNGWLARIQAFKVAQGVWTALVATVIDSRNQLERVQEKDPGTGSGKISGKEFKELKVRAPHLKGE
ncbi:hypothetical protein DUI87_18720 [Hirundo rustica rustica]|uniref:Uncharacterized protein n=1 Tax=Hirundo rustica rustica TaxID=333673 RepID=A0A3M0K2S5_HIRRU|nr:hypothetical protein DUI87_18720 [Hirundo rustica rustica]